MRALLLIPFFALAPAIYPAHGEERTLKIVVDTAAPAEIRQAAQEILTGIGRSPLLTVMAGEGAPPSAVTDSKALAAAPFGERAYSHLVVVGLPDDPMVAQVWQREAAVRDGRLFIFGFGHLLGGVGYIESDRNPFLHGREVKRAPFEAEVVTITGLTPAAVGLAAKAFLEKGIVNGVVAAPGWRRGESALLERPPLEWKTPIPDSPAIAEGWTRIALTQAAEEEYRGVLADVGIAPGEIWRVKYYRPGVWDGAGAEKAFAHYSAGLHRRASGNTLWMARFPSEADADSAAPKIAIAAGLQQEGARWRGKQPPSGFGGGSRNEAPGELSLWQRGRWVYMSTLPQNATEALARAVKQN